MLQNPRLIKCSVGRRGIAPASETHLFGLFLSCPVRRIQRIPQTVGKLPQLLLLWLPLHGAGSERVTEKTEKEKKVESVCKEDPALQWFARIRRKPDITPQKDPNCGRKRIVLRNGGNGEEWFKISQ